MSCHRRVIAIRLKADPNISRSRLSVNWYPAFRCVNAVILDMWSTTIKREAHFCKRHGKHPVLTRFRQLTLCLSKRTKCRVAGIAACGKGEPLAFLHFWQWPLPWFTHSPAISRIECHCINSCLITLSFSWYCVFRVILRLAFSRKVTLHYYVVTTCFVAVVAKIRVYIAR